MKIAHIITALSVGGAETMLYKLLSNAEFKKSTIVVSLRTKGEFGDKIEALGVPVYTCEMPRGQFTLKGFFRLLKILKEFQPNIVQTWMYHADLVGGVASKISGCRHVIWNIRQSNLDHDKNRYHTLLVTKICSVLSRVIPKRIICNSKNAAKNHIDIGYSNKLFDIIPNGFDADVFRPNQIEKKDVLKELGINSSSKIVGMVARFDSQKNHFGFVEAAKIINNHNDNVYFVLIGTDIDKSNSELLEWIKSAGLLSKFILLGRRDDIPRLTNAFDLAICSSWGEGFSNTLGEAMLTGVPVVTTEVGDCAEIVGDFGWTVKPGDMASLAQYVINALEKPEHELKKIGIAARQSMINRYSISAIASRYRALYTDVLNGVC